MKIIFFSSNMDMIQEWENRHTLQDYTSCYDTLSLVKELINTVSDYTLIADYDTVAHEINKLISSNRLPDYTIVLERTPELSSGKMLISHGVKAYGNSRMLNIHYLQMIETVQNGKIWTYPELTSALAKSSVVKIMNEDSVQLIQHRLSPKEIEVVYLILDGLTNDAIAKELSITIRTVKAHVSSIFSKLHVNDRISLVLLLK